MGRQGLRGKARADRRRGFSLVEVMVAIAIMTLGALVLTMSLSSADRMNSLARERQVANAAIRSYVEAMRQKYPTVQNSQDMTEFFNDTTTPKDYLPAATTSPIERGILKDIEAYVVKCCHENPSVGLVWAGAAGTVADSTRPTVLVVPKAIFGPNDNQLASALTVTDADRRALGYLLGNMELDGDTATTGALLATTAVRMVPCKIEMSWISGSSTKVAAGVKRQKVTVYVMFNPLH